MRLAIDDVGAGFSSLRHIVLTEPDVIKLDRSIVDGVTHDPVLARSSAPSSSSASGLRRVVAEGIETADDAGPSRPTASTTGRAGTSAAPARRRPGTVPHRVRRPVASDSSR